MATAITAAPSLPTSVAKAKGFATNVGDKALWVLAAVAALGLAKMALPYLASVPVVGRAFGAGSPGAAAVDSVGFGA